MIVGSPYNDIIKNQEDYNDNCGCWDIGFMRNVQNSGNQVLAQPFKKGVYTFSLDGINNHTINYSSINAKYFLLQAIPVIKTGSDGKITSVAIDYMLPDKTPVQTAKYITTVAIQFHNNTGLLYQEGSLFDLMNVLPDFNNVTISKDVNINDVTGMDICYTDLVGNMYALTWRKP